jgi:hypothetical protein
MFAYKSVGGYPIGVLTTGSNTIGYPSSFSKNAMQVATRNPFQPKLNTMLGNISIVVLSRQINPRQRRRQKSGRRTPRRGAGAGQSASNCAKIQFLHETFKPQA